MKLPDARRVDAPAVQRIVDEVGRDQLAASLFVPTTAVQTWMRDGVPDGPVAACLRGLALQLGPVLAIGSCVLCGAPAGAELADTPVCAGCWHVSEDALNALGLVYRDQTWPGSATPDAVRVGSLQAFERPVFVKFSPQKRFKRGDPELGDEGFDAAVWIETDEYEAVFDTFSALRRRQLVYYLTRSGHVTVNVNEVTYERIEGAPRGRDVALQVTLLAWSLLHEKSHAWDF